MLCDQCGAENRPNARFCNRCGVLLAPVVAASLRDDETRLPGTPSPGTPPTPGLPDRIRQEGGTVWMESLSVGQMLGGRYEIQRLLGSGGMGQVWAAQDRELDMVVAVKVLPPLLAANPRARDAMKREAALSLKVTHPNICRLYNFHSEGDLGFLVMEYVAGRTLEQIQDDKPDRRMGLEEVLPIFAAVAEAIDFAHRHQPPILHRDIKPANIMVGENGSVKVMDFGIACELRQNLTRMTGQASAGTLLYMSPEQLRGKTLSPASDVYSLAASLYECLTGHPPFHTGEIAYQIVHEAPVSLRELGAKLPTHVDAGILKALSKQPDERPACCSELTRTLRGQGTEPSTVIVSANGAGDYRTITAALAHVPAGGTIRVRPAVYREALVIGRPVEIVGDGPLKDVVIECDTTHCLWLKSDRVVVRNLSIVGKASAGASPADGSAVLVTHGSPLIEGCNITARGDCLKVMGSTASPVVRDCRIHDSQKGSGIVVSEQGNGMFDGCDVFSNEVFGFEVKFGGNPIMRNCRVRDNHGVGICVWNRGEETTNEWARFETATRGSLWRFVRLLPLRNDEEIAAAMRAEIFTPSSRIVYSFLWLPKKRQYMEFMAGDANGTLGTLFVTFKAWHPGMSKKRGGAGGKPPNQPGAVYAFSNVPLRKYQEFKSAAETSAGGAVWDYLRVRGSKFGHQHPYRLVAGVIMPAGGEYVPRKALATGYRTRTLVNPRTGERMRSQLDEELWETPEATYSYAWWREIAVERSRNYWARAHRGGADRGMPDGRTTDDKSSAVIVSVDGQGAFECCEVYGNKGVGVDVSRGGSPTVTNCSIHDNSGGVAVSDGANPTLRNCKIHDNQSSGVSVWDKGLGTFEGCEIAANRLSGVAVAKDGNATVRNCRIHDNEVYGVTASSRGHGAVLGCDLRGNGRGAIWGCRLQQASNIVS